MTEKAMESKSRYDLTTTMVGNSNSLKSPRKMDLNMVSMKRSKCAKYQTSYKTGLRQLERSKRMRLILFWKRSLSMTRRNFFGGMRRIGL
jgi:hypothetical protein